MSIKATTKYTKKRIIRFDHYSLFSRNYILIVCAVITLLILALYVAKIALLKSLVSFLIIDLCEVLWFFIFPYTLLRTDKTVDATVDFVFGDEEYTVSVNTGEINESSTAKYTALIRAIKRGSELYLYFTPKSGYIVDLSSMTDEDAELLKETLSKYIKPKKFRWK